MDQILFVHRISSFFDKKTLLILQSGGPFWRVKTGHMDGRISMASEALSNIPAPSFNFSQLKDSFARKGLNIKDLVVLSGTSESTRSIQLQCSNLLFFASYMIC
jgi:hypothetical protein